METPPQLPRAESLSYADYGVFCPELLLWVISGMHDSRAAGDRGVFFH